MPKFLVEHGHFYGLHFIALAMLARATRRPMAVNQVTPNQMRGQISSMYLFTINLIGMGVGPALVPFIGDYILRDPMQIRWALLIVVVSATSVAATLLWLARPLFREKIAATSNWH